MKTSLLLALLVASPLLAVEVATTDGRRLQLNDDGTYQFLPPAQTQSDDVVTVPTQLFEHHESEYGRKSVRFMPIFDNHTDKTVVAIKFRSDFKDPFGDSIFTFEGKTSAPIESGTRSEPQLFYAFEDNQFIPAEPYDKLLPFVLNNTGTVETQIIAVALQGGETLTFE